MKVFIVGDGIVGEDYIEKYNTSTFNGNKPHYVHPLAYSLLAGTLVSELINHDFDDKDYDPYKLK